MPGDGRIDAPLVDSIPTTGYSHMDPMDENIDYIESNVIIK
jgi:hypothetical protein